MHLNFRIIIFCLLLSFPFLSSGQGTGNSPFSQFGIGDLGNYQGNIRNMGMGYAGVSAKHTYYVNLLNPALIANLRTPKKPRLNHSYKSWEYYYNQRVDSTVKLDFAVTYQRRSIQSSGSNESTGGMNIAYFAFAIPLTKTWSTALGIQPYSVVNYNLYTSSPVIGNPSISSQNTNSGKGGIYKIFWSHGVGITNNLAVGLESSVLYGNINTEDLSSIPDFSTTNYGFRRQNSYSSLNFKPGIHFRREIIQAYKDTTYKKDSIGTIIDTVLVRKTKSSGMFYNIGFTTDFNTALNITRELNIYVFNSTNQIITDSSIGKSKYKAQLPPTFRLGFSLDVPHRWTVAADVFYSNWSVYKPSFSIDTLRNSYGFNIGGEFTAGQKIRSKTYRVGFSYILTPVVYQNNQLSDISVSIGGTIPFGRRTVVLPVLPRLNVAVVAGQRGNVGDFSIREQYIKVYLGILINDKWFNKRKIY